MRFKDKVVLVLGGNSGMGLAAAKAFVSRAARFVGQSAIQLHGGMGLTDDLAVSHYFKRATMIESQFGSADHHAARLEALATHA